MKDVLNRPCNACPFSPSGPGGWLGPYKDAKELHDLVCSEVPFPCHQTMAGEEGDDGYEETGEEAYCVGALHYMANISKLPRDRSIPRKAKSALAVRNLEERIEHHTLVHPAAKRKAP